MQLVPGDPAILVAGLSATPAGGRAGPRSSSASTSRSTSSSGAGTPNLAAGRPRHLLPARPRASSQATIERLPVSISIALYALVMTLAVRHPRRRARGAAPEHLARPGGHDDRADRRQPAQFLARPDADRRCSRCSSAGCRRGGYVDFRDDFVGWLRPPTLPAISLAHAADGAARAHHPLDHARGAAPGLHPHRARQGPARAPWWSASTRSRTR